MKCKKCHKEIENLEVCPYCKCKQLKEKVLKETKKGIDVAEKELKKIPIINNSKFITYILMGILVLKLILGSISIDLSFIGYLLRNLATIFLFIYFLLLNVDYGKKKFTHLNLIVCILLLIQGIIPIFSLFVKFYLFRLLYCFASFLLAFYFGKNFIEEYVEDISILDAFNNKEYFYLIVGTSLLSIIFAIPSFVNSSIIYIILELLSIMFICVMSRYIYLYKEEKKGLFTDIKKEQEVLSKKDLKKTTKSILKKYNGYQLFGFFILILGFVFGIYIGSESATCTEVSMACAGSSFEFSIMFLIVGVSLFICILLFWMGQVIDILKKIAQKK